MNYKKTILLILFFIAFAVCGLWLWSNIFYPSYLSVSNACNFLNESELASRGMMVGGSTLFNFTFDNETDSFIPDISFQFISADRQTIRHELVHKHQISNHRFYSCQSLFWKYVNELEAYTLQHFPIYNDEIKLIQEQLNETIN